MKKKLFFYITLIVCLGLLGFFGMSVFITYFDNLKIAKDTVIETAEILANFYTEDTDLSSFVKAGTETRITVIARDGRVLADSYPLDVSEMENHLHRSEIQAALRSAPSPYVRRSESLRIDHIYYALKVDSGESYVFIRAAIPVVNVDAYMSQSLTILVIFLFVIAMICFIFIRNMINKILEPISLIGKKMWMLLNGKYKAESVTVGCDEIDIILKEFDDLGIILQDNMNILRDEKNKLDYILDNIGDGLFVADESGEIALINSAALDIFSVTPDIIHKNLNYLVNEKMLIGAVEDCVTGGKGALFEIVLNGSIFLVTVKRLPGTRLTMVVLSNVTENRENAKRREDFFANASHELKTPLTAIIGFNELAALNNKDENIRKYIDSIKRETERMLSLITDMLKLSELTTTHDVNPEPVQLAKTVNEAREALLPAIERKSITFDVTGDAVISAESGHIYELVKNLVENAVRYNEEKGGVSVKIEKEKNAVQLLVVDNGIGISPEEQNRIFERFYRVEKSRSPRNGGTGLGLSIVKHICTLYGWKLSLKSKLGVGTEVSVTFSS